MSFFDSPKPKVTKREFHKEVLNNLASGGMPRHKRNKVEMLFQGDFEERHSAFESGIDKKEVGERMAWAREHQSKTGLSDHDIDEIEEELHKHL